MATIEGSAMVGIVSRTASDSNMQENYGYISAISSARTSSFRLGGSARISDFHSEEMNQFFKSTDVNQNMQDSSIQEGVELTHHQGHESVTSHDVSINVNSTLFDGKPSPHLNLKFKDVKYKIVLQKSTWGKRTSTEKEILHGVSGSISSGEMLAIMGPSGSGKTTLLNVLGRRKVNLDHVNGSILYNDAPFVKQLKKRMGFVTQDDVLFPHLTVRETLTFSALLRLSNSLTKEQKCRRVEEVIEQLGLQKCSNTVIGNQFVHGISGGERKRVCIGQEVLIDPTILLLDEPSSGLDSTTTLQMIKLIKTIAHEGKRMVITTIHQPSSRVFHMFDKLLLLTEGQALYFGKARDAMTYFSSIGFTPSIPMNPADFLLDLCCTNFNDISVPNLPASTQKQLSETDIMKYLLDSYRDQVAYVGIDKENYNPIATKFQTSNIDVVMLEKEKLWNNNWWHQFSVLLIRSLKERKHEHLGFLRVLQVLVSAFIAGAVWWKSNNSTPQQFQDQVGLLFFITIFWAYLPLFTAIFTFPLERAILAKECSLNMYRLSAYFMARTLGDLPLDLSLPLLFMLILYFMANLQHSFISFFLTLMTVFLTVTSAQGFGLLIGAVVMDVQQATTFASIAILAFMLVGGFFVKSIPTFIGWIKYFSFQAHSYNILVHVQYANDCLNIEGCEQIEATLALHNTVKSILVMLLMVFGYRILAYIALRRMGRSY